jgi:hypothetical protein
LGYFFFPKKTSKSKNNPMGENSPNLVTLFGKDRKEGEENGT